MNTSAMPAMVAVCANGLVAGVFLAVALSVIPTLRALDLKDYIRVHTLLGKGFHPFMPLIVTVGLLGEIGIAILSPAHRLAALVGLVATLGVQVVSHFGNVPINRVVHALNDGTAAVEEFDPRPRWRRLHYIRMSLALVSFGLTLTALI